MTLRDIYTIYFIPHNLAQHHLRVAALAQLIGEHWQGPALDFPAIVEACTAHDLAKPMTFDLAKQAQFGMSAAEIARLEQYQIRLKTQYGENEHHTTLALMQEIGCSAKAIHLVDNLEWKYIPRLIQVNDLESLIPIYSDMRIGPNGILPLLERLQELKDRTDAKEYEANVQNGTAVEALLKKQITIDLNAITDEQLNAHFEDLLNQSPNGA